MSRMQSVQNTRNTLILCANFAKLCPRYQFEVVELLQKSILHEKLYHKRSSMFSDKGICLVKCIYKTQWLINPADQHKTFTALCIHSVLLVFRPLTFAWRWSKLNFTASTTICKFALAGQLISLRNFTGLHTWRLSQCIAWIVINDKIGVLLSKN